MDVEFHIDKAPLERLVRRSPELARRFIGQVGQAVESEAVRQIDKAGRLRAEKTGNLKGSIGTRVSGGGSNPKAVVYASASYAAYVHEGTGIYGPKRRPIVAVNAKALMFEVGGQTIFRRSVKGMKPRPFLREAVKRIVPEKFARIFKRVAGETIGWKRG